MGCVPTQERQLQDCSAALYRLFSNSFDILHIRFQRLPKAFQHAFPSLTLKTLRKSVKGPATALRITETVRLLKTVVWGISARLIGTEELENLLYADVSIRYETLQLLFYIYDLKLKTLPVKLRTAIRKIRPRLTNGLLTYSRAGVANVQVYLLSSVLLQDFPDQRDLSRIHLWVLEAFDHLLDCEDLIGILAFLLKQKDDVVAKYLITDEARLNYIKRLSLLDIGLLMDYLSCFPDVGMDLLSAIFSTNPQDYLDLHDIKTNLCSLLRSEERLKLFLKTSQANSNIVAVIELCNSAVVQLEQERKYNSARVVLQEMLSLIPPKQSSFETHLNILSQSFELMGTLDVSNDEVASNYIDQLIVHETNNQELKSTEETLRRIISCLCRNSGLPLYEGLLTKYIVHIIDYQLIQPPVLEARNMIIQCCKWLPQIKDSVLLEVRRVIDNIRDLESESMKELVLLETELSDPIAAVDSRDTKALLSRFAAVIIDSVKTIESNEQRSVVIAECETFVEECGVLPAFDYRNISLTQLDDYRVFPKIVQSALRETAQQFKMMLGKIDWTPDPKTIHTWRIMSISLEKFSNSLFFQLLFLKATQKPLCCLILTEYLDLLQGELNWDAIALNKTDINFAYYILETRLISAALHGFETPNAALFEHLTNVAKSECVSDAFGNLSLSTAYFNVLLRQIYFTTFPIQDYGKTIYGGIILLSRSFLLGGPKDTCAMKVTLCHELAHASRRLVDEDMFQVEKRSPVTTYDQGMIGRPDLLTTVSDDAEGGRALENELFGAFITLIGYDQIVYLCRLTSWNQPLQRFKKALVKLGENEPGEPLKLYRSERGHISFDRTEDKPCTFRSDERSF